MTKPRRLTLLCLSCALASHAMAVEPTALALVGPCVTVTATGQSAARPDVVEIVFSTSGTGELSNDAIDKFRSSTKKMVEAISALGIKNLAVANKGFGVRSAQPATDAVAFEEPATEPEGSLTAPVVFSRQVVLQISEIAQASDDQMQDTLGRVLDTVKDAGVRGGFTVKYIVRDSNAVRQAAYKDAINQARQRAADLAALSNRQLGNVVNIVEASTEPTPEMKVLQSLGAPMILDPAEPNRLTSEKFEPIALAVTLTTTFELKP